MGHRSGADFLYNPFIMKNLQTILLGLVIALVVIYIAYNETRFSEIERSINEIIVAQTELKEINAVCYVKTQKKKMVVTNRIPGMVLLY